MRVKLIVSRGSNEGKAFDVNVPQFVIGRAKGCQLRPQSDAISRQHCVICVTDESATIRDLGSRNGTVVNGEKIDGTYTFVDGDDLRVGPLHLTVSIGADAEQTVATDTETLSASSDETQTVKSPNTASEPMPTQSMPIAKGKGPADISDSGDISDWLDEEDSTDDTQIRKSQTRQFRLDESERIEVQKAATDEEEIDLTEKQKTTSKKKKKEYGKLPERKKDETADSREAAESTLRQMFNKGL